MTNEDDDKELYEGCQIYLGRIEREKALMVAAGADTKKVNEHQEWIAKYKRLLAKHLGDRSIICNSASGRQHVMPCWMVYGQPPKQFKAQAREWMAARGLTWTGVPDFKGEVQNALEDGEQVPEGYFGLRVERTVEIEQLAPANKSPSHDSPRQS